jgi:cytochrome c-type biogenesis protein CcmH
VRRVASLAALLTLLTTAAAGAAPPRASLTDIEPEVMCVTCRIPLSVADSAQADRERAFIRGLIRQGRTKQQILDAMVASYGPRVLATPSTSGVDLTAWLVPGGLVVVLLGAGLLAIPRWRRRGNRSRPAPAGPALATADARRLDEELARWDDQ